MSAPMGTSKDSREYSPGDVFQIVSVAEGRDGWLGAFVMATEIKAWGVQGFVHHVSTHEAPAQVFIRLKWGDLAYIGRAALVAA